LSLPSQLPRGSSSLLAGLAAMRTYITFGDIDGKLDALRVVDTV
jgi:hypothetical protein